MPPKDKTLEAFWRECDISDILKTKNFIFNFKPTMILHLATFTDTKEIFIKKMLLIS